MDRRDPRHDASNTEAPATDQSALELALRSGRGTTDLGVDRRAPRLLEIAQIWSDTLLSVRHFGANRRTVTVGDSRSRRRFGLSGALVAILLFGVTGFMVRHATLPEPVRLSDEDASFIATWTADAEAVVRARAETRRAAGDSAPVPPDPAPSQDEALDGDPLAELAETWRAHHRAELKNSARRMKAGRAERRLLEVPPFHLDEQPQWEAMLRDELLPRAEVRATDGTLPPSWVRALKTPSRTFDGLEEPEVARVAEDVPASQRVRRSGEADAPVWTVVRGLDPGAVYISDGKETREIAPDTSLWPWMPTDADAAAREQLVHAAQAVLYTDALASRASRRTCEAVEQLLGFDDERGRIDLNARAARCALNRGEDLVATQHIAVAEAAVASGTTTTDADAITVLLRTRSRLDLKAFAKARETDRRVETRERAEASAQALRGHIVAILRAPSELASVARDRHQLALDRLHEQQEEQVQRAGLLGFLVLLMLPLGLIVDERRARRRACDFFVDSGDLPATSWPFVERDAVGVAVRLPLGTSAWRRRAGADQTLGELTAAGEAEQDGEHVRVRLEESDQFVATISGATFVVQSVHPTRPVPGRSATVDWPYLGVLAALLFLSAAFTIVLSTTDQGPTTEIAQIDDRLLRIALAEPEKPVPSVVQPREREDAGEGKRAPDPEGQRGRKDAMLKKAKGAKVAVRRAEMDRQIALRSGIISDLDRMTADGTLGQDGERTDRIATAMGALIGTQWGDQRGDGLASRGGGTGGGCMGEDCGPYTIGGTGTEGRGGGHDGDGKDAGDVGDHVESGPEVGVKDPIMIGNVDKATVDRIVKQHLPQIRTCYERELSRNPKLSGKVTVKFVIAKDGSVSMSSSAHSTLRSPVAEACVHGMFRRMRFPPPRGGGIAMIRYPLIFNSR
jgi:hypothetical protein